MKRLAIVIYDPADPQHRSDLFHVMQQKTFTGCQHMYALEGSHGDVLSMMKERTLDWYVRQEFTQS